MFKGRHSYPPLIRGEAALSNAGYQENVSRERRLGKSMKESEAIAYGEMREAHQSMGGHVEKMRLRGANKRFEDHIDKLKRR